MYNNRKVYISDPIYLLVAAGNGCRKKTEVKGMEIRNMREIREYVAEIRGTMSPKRAETVIRRLIVLKIEEMNPFLERDIDCLIKAVNEPDDEHRNLVCDIVEHTLDNIKRGRY